MPDMTQTTPPTHLVLYTDDDIDDIKFVEESFSETARNVELVTAYNGLDLIRYLEGLNPLDPDPCLIILDVNMPLMNGKEALLKIRQMDRYQNIPIVLFTTSSSPLDKMFAEKHNVELFTKPHKFDSVPASIRQMLEKCAGR